MILSVLSGSCKQNQYPAVPGTLNVTNKLPKTKHSLNIDVNQ